MGRVIGNQNSIRKDNVLDLEISSIVSGGGLPTTDSSIITLVLGESVEQGQIIAINSNEGKAYIASNNYEEPAVGFAVVGGSANDTISVKISGIFSTTTTSNVLYLGSSGYTQSFIYDDTKYLQRVGYKIDANNIYIDIGEKVLML